MTPQDFTYWLDGYIRANKYFGLDYKKTAIVKEKLNSVFHKVTPQTTQPFFGTPIPIISQEGNIISPESGVVGNEKNKFHTLITNTRITC